MSCGDGGGLLAGMAVVGLLVVVALAVVGYRAGQDRLPRLLCHSCMGGAAGNLVG